jgi:hypothetical protein
MVPLADDIDMWADDEAIFNSPVNVVATVIAQGVGDRVHPDPRALGGEIGVMPCAGTSRRWLVARRPHRGSRVATPRNLIYY